MGQSRGAAMGDFKLLAKRRDGNNGRNKTLPRLPPAGAACCEATGMICHERCRGLQTSASDMTKLTLFTPSRSLDGAD